MDYFSVWSKWAEMQEFFSEFLIELLNTVAW